MAGAAPTILASTTLTGAMEALLRSREAVSTVTFTQ